MTADDPYLGRESVFHFDQMISAAVEKNRLVAEWTHSNALPPLQKAASEILPHAFSLACAVRELIRTGYLFPAEVLIRPLLERAAVISYLVEVPDSVPLWEKGWPYKTRPSLAAMLVHMRGAKHEDKETARLIVDHFNAINPCRPIRLVSQFGNRQRGSHRICV